MGCCISVTALKPTESVLQVGYTSKKVVEGPGFVVTPPFVSARKQKAQALEAGEYLHILNTLTGEHELVVGPALRHIGPWEEVLGRPGESKRGLVLAMDEWAHLRDERNGSVRLVRGETLCYPEPWETVLHGGKQKGYPVDRLNAVLVRSLETGELRLVVEEGLFVPGPLEKVECRQKCVQLAEYEVAILQGPDGGYQLRHGDSKEDEERQFFVPPHHRIVELQWSSGPRKDARGRTVKFIDKRPAFMNYEFVCRTSDNVEVVVDTTFFWSVRDVHAMLRYTDDAPGDICHHARSLIIQAVSNVSLERFMAEFNSIVTEAVLGHGDAFYDERGVVIHSVEVRSTRCKDPHTQAVLQAIIEENTNRTNRIQKQESENEVALHKLRGRIEEEKHHGELLDIRHSHHRAEAVMVGEAEADRVKAFLAGIDEEVADVDMKMKLYRAIRRLESVSSIAKGDSKLYFTPAAAAVTVVADASGDGGASAATSAAVASSGAAAAAAAALPPPPLATMPPPPLLSLAPRR